MAGVVKVLAGVGAPRDHPLRLPLEEDLGEMVIGEGVVVIHGWSDPTLKPNLRLRSYNGLTETWENYRAHIERVRKLYWWNEEEAAAHLHALLKGNAASCINTATVGASLGRTYRVHTAGDPYHGREMIRSTAAPKGTHHLQG